MDSGYEFLDDAFSFPNYGGELNARLTPDLVARMCGPELVCANGEIPCEIKPLARRWMESTNRTLDEGRSEGFAILSLLFFDGHLDPEDFGGPATASLRLYQNRKLQEELAYWAATQAVPSATKDDVRYGASDVIPFLARALDPKSEQRYRLAIARKTDEGFAGGHALVPIGYYKGEGDLYWLRVYDSNFPQREQRIAIDPKANTWRYEFPGLDGETIVYEGTADNGNLLYFSPIEPRLGTLVCPFDPSAESHTLAYSGLNLVETAEDGSQTGIVDGEVIESGEGRVTPAFSACPRCGEQVQVINQRSIAAGVSKLVVESTGDVTVDTDEESAQITGSGPNYTATVTPQGSTKKDRVSFGSDGSVEYQSQSSDSVHVSTSRTRDDGTTEEVSVQIEGGGGEGSVQVTVTPTDDGKAKVDVKGAPAGSTVTVVVQNSEGESESVTYTSTGEDSSATVDPDSGDVTARNVDNLSGGSCINGVLDAPNETDVDCGGSCNPCADGKTCSSDDDCQFDRCKDVGGSKQCRAAHCESGVKDGTETDVDCGGPACEPCAASDYNQSASNFSEQAPSCAQDSDCDSGYCVGARYGQAGHCVKKNEVVLKLNTVGPYNLSRRFEYALDGVRSAVRIDKASPDGPYEIALGQAYSYRLDGLGFNTDCVSRNIGTFYTGKDGADDTALGGIIEVSCADGPGAHLPGSIAYHDGVPALPATDPLRVEVSYDGGTPQSVALDGSLPSRDDLNAVTLGWYTENWSASIVGQPSQLYTNPNTGEQDRVYCLLAHRGGAYNSRPDHRVKLEVTCDWASKGTCDDGKRSTQFLQETDVDCGGKCEPCTWGKMCWSDSDCVDRCVDFPSKRCEDPSKKYDGVQNQGETGVDCGGPINITLCQDGQGCSSHDDCVGVCQSGTCAPRSCSDGVKNGHETGTDCGGSANYADACSDDKCPVGEGCLSNHDCATGYCAGGTCQSAPCADGVKNGLESDVDCGGPGCSSCADAKSCAANSDCASGFCGRTSKVCETSACTNGTRDGDETDVDCGGATCYPCADGKACSSNTDCTSGTCDGGFCATASCTDGRKNGDEVDVDCGGSCDPCADGSFCVEGADCESKVCDANKCKAPWCYDRVHNGEESDVDCGGGCFGCAVGKACTTGDDCASKLCDNGTCTESRCDDGRKGGYETGVDCGGSQCDAQCPGGQGCNKWYDCKSYICEGATWNSLGVCKASACDDNRRNGDESDLDCGGPDCAGCAVGKRCSVGSDCASQFCEDGLCADSPCTDGVKNGSETDVDCGGSCDGCADGKACSSADDCASGACSAGACAAPSCTDGVKNGDETDVDCGGSSCDGCAASAGCSADTDCASGNCESGSCAAPSCTDGVKNGTETDADCGGGSCDACGVGEACGAGSDCASSSCDAGVCAAPSCTDGVKNGAETDTDCGGDACDGCGVDAACLVAGDCASGVCAAGVCAAPSCTDGINNGTETDVDCGGGSCGGCAENAACLVGGDCASGSCLAGVCGSAPTCDDGAKNGDETDVDCGGATCAACAIGQGCTTDADCTSGDCWCSGAAGNCAAASGVCGAARTVIDQPTADGITASGSFTVPAQCTQVHVQAWGAAGGPARDALTFMNNWGGAGGYLSGTLSASPGDVIDVWIGAGGEKADPFAGGTNAMGSNLGTPVTGGTGGYTDFDGEGGGGGGLTSVRQSGGAQLSFLVPGGGGGSGDGVGQDVTAGMGGGNLFGSSGEDSGFNSTGGGGGAGEQGGSAFFDFAYGAAAGTYGPLPAGFTSTDGASGQPANTGSPDYASCLGVTNGSPGAGASDAMQNLSGAGCVVLRCVAP